MMTGLTELQRCMCDVLDCDTTEVPASAMLEDVPGWDSMNALRLLAAIESHFGVRLDLRTYAAVETVGQLCGMIASESVPCATR